MVAGKPVALLKLTLLMLAFSLGLTLGGGYGVLSGTRGLVIDNTVEFEIVLANGDIKRASKKENPDLHWALNGAGQNFGVTTEFVLQAYPQKELYLGTMLFPATEEHISKLVAALNELYKVTETPEGPQTKSKGKAMSLVGFAKPPPAEGQTMVLMNAVYDGSEEEGKAMLQPFFDIGPVVNEMRMDAYPTCNKLVPAMYGMRGYYIKYNTALRYRLIIILNAFREQHERRSVSRL